MTDGLSELEQLGAFDPLDVELARALCRLAGEQTPELALAVALASREVQAGHVCADLNQLAGAPICEEAGQPAAARFPALAPWLDALARSPLVSRHGLDAAAPLVLDDRGRLYLARYYDHERRLAEQVRTLTASPAAASPSDALVTSLFPAPSEQRDAQREAALAARGRRLSVIVGGPGTGKTSTVVKLLALLVHDALAAGQAPPRTLLVAPTGKAAQRLRDAVEAARARLPIAEPIKSAIETGASTLHRALGPLDGSLTRFRHGRERPLDCDLIVLDEASMVDLALMRRFLDAVPAHARVILLGDPDQLASVEAGGVLHDLCRAAEYDQSPLAGCVSRLTESYRYPPDSGIAALARAVHGQEPEQALAVLRADLPDVRWHAPLSSHELSRPLEREAREHYAALREGELEARLSALDRFRVLCAHRTGPASVEQLNPALSRALGQRGAGASYPGRPILITQNDYATQLFNGDVGVVQLERARARELVACFRGSAGELRRIAVARLPQHESAYAMTVHKSQGSEFDQVAIVLPERPSRILSRELLYTAITRARRGVSLYANETALRAAIGQRITRSSGLVDLLAR